MSNILFSILSALIRIIFIPISDYPDFESVAPEFISRISLGGESLISDLLYQTHCGTVPDNLIKSYVFGSVYQCHLVLAPLSYFFVSFLLWLIFSILLSLLTKTSRRVDKQARSIINKMVFFIFAIPSTFYYVLNIHPEIPYSIFSILLVSSMITGILSGQQNSKPRIFLFLISYIILVFRFPENQALIVAATYFLLLFSSKYFVSIEIVSKIIQSAVIQFKGFLKPRLVVTKLFLPTFTVLVVAILFIYRINIYILTFVSSLGIPILSFVALHYTTYYVDVSDKYPLLIRLFGLLQTSLLRTPSNFSVSIVSFSLFFIAILIGGLRLFSCSNRLGIEKIKSMILFSVPSIILVVAILPGFSNYKYYVGFTPLIAICMSFSYRISLISIFFVYSEIVIRSSLSGAF